MRVIARGRHKMKADARSRDRVDNDMPHSTADYPRPIPPAFPRVERPRQMNGTVVGARKQFAEFMGMKENDIHIPSSIHKS